MNPNGLQKILSFYIASIAFLIGCYFFFDLSIIVTLIAFVLVSAIFVCVAIVLSSQNSKSKSPFYNYKNQSIVEIKIQPLRIILLGLVLIFIGCFFSFLFVDSFQFLFKKDNIFDDLIFILLISAITLASLYGLFHGVKLLLRSNRMIQIRFDSQTLSYMPVNYDLTGKASGWEVLKMYFDEPRAQLKFEDIQTLKLEKPKWGKHGIRIFLKNGSNFSLPFLFYDENQLDELYTALIFRVGKSNSIES